MSAARRDDLSPVDALTPGADGARLEQVLTRAERDEAFSQELDLVADLFAAAERERTVLAPAAAAGRRATRHLRLGLAAAAAGLALLAWTLWPRASVRSLARLDAPVYLPADLRTATPGGDLATEFAQAMRAYAAGDAARAADDLGAFLARHPDHGPARFYRGACRVRLGDPHGAAADLERVTRAEGGRLGDHARWLLAQVRLAQGDARRARSELERLARGGGAFAAPAAELLERLERALR